MPIHPFFLAFYVVLSLYAENITEVYLNAIWRILIVLILCISILLALLGFLTRDWQRSGLALSLFLLLFLSYGHVHEFKDVAVGGIYIFRHKYLVVIWLLLGIAGEIYIYRAKNLATLARFANTMSILMLLFPVFNIGLFTIRQNAYNSRVENRPLSPSGLSVSQPAPDVYFIVLDAYGRADILQDMFKFDNSEFIRELQDMGFYVVQCSQSNYARTRLSIASTLNMDYIQNLVPDPNAEEVNSWIGPLLLENQARNLFEELGYKTVAFRTDYRWINWRDADYFLYQGEGQSSNGKELASNLTSFEELFLNTTLFNTIIDLQEGNPQLSSVQTRRDIDLFIMETLPKIPGIAGSKFVYAHIILPHPPFVFGPNGEEVAMGPSDYGFNDVTQYADGENRIRYRDQVIYTNRQIVPILRSIIDNSPTPPVIVLESDHGPTGYGGPLNRMGNLMAYYFPGKDTARLAYPSITPVNSFRLVFNTYFGGNYPLLDDLSYYSLVTSDFDYQIVPNTCAQQ